MSGLIRIGLASSWSKAAKGGPGCAPSPARSTRRTLRRASTGRRRFPPWSPHCASPFPEATPQRDHLVIWFPVRGRPGPGTSTRLGRGLGLGLGRSFDARPWSGDMYDEGSIRPQPRRDVNGQDQAPVGERGSGSPASSEGNRSASPLVQSVVHRSMSAAVLGQQRQLDRRHRTRRTQHRVCQLGQLVATSGQTRVKLVPET